MVVPLVAAAAAGSGGAAGAAGASAGGASAGAAGASMEGASAGATGGGASGASFSGGLRGASRPRSLGSGNYRTIREIHRVKGQFDRLQSIQGGGEDDEAKESGRAMRSGGIPAALNAVGAGGAADVAKDFQKGAMMGGAAGGAAMVAYSILKEVQWSIDWLIGMPLLLAVLKDLVDWAGLAILPGVNDIIVWCISILTTLIMIFLGASGARTKVKVASSFVKKAVTIVGGTLCEELPGVNFIPIMTLTVVVAYILVLLDRKQDRAAQRLSTEGQGVEEGMGDESEELEWQRHAQTEQSGGYSQGGNSQLRMDDNPSGESGNTSSQSSPLKSPSPIDLHDPKFRPAGFKNDNNMDFSPSSRINQIEPWDQDSVDWVENRGL